MKRFITALSAVIALALPVTVIGANWKIDPDHSSIGFKVRHLMVTNVNGTFNKYSGTIDINDQDISKSRVDVTIDTNSIDTKVEKRDEHLRSPDFFDVAKYPTMTFVSKKVAKSGKDRLKITGDLTIHGVTRPVVLDVTELTKETKDPMGNIRRGASANTKINRKDFGLTWNKVLETGGVAVGDEVAIILELELLKAK